MVALNGVWMQVTLLFQIVGFIILRNCNFQFRNRFSYFFAFFGKISLELFIAQYHIWLGSNTKGKTTIDNFFNKNEPIRTSFCLFLFVQQVTIQILIDKSEDGVLGIQTWGGRMEGADESTELQRHPSIENFYTFYNFQ